METPYVCLDLDRDVIALAVMTPALAAALNRESQETAAGLIWIPAPMGEA